MTNKRQCYLLKLKNKKLSKMHLYPCVYLYIIISCYNFDETIFNIILYTLDTKYTVILNFNVSHTIYPQLCIVPL